MRRPSNSFGRKALWVGFVPLCCSLLSLGQSCALCYTQAASAPSRFIEGLKSGILILIFPPLLITLAIGIAAYHKRNQSRFGPEDESLPLAPPFAEEPHAR